MTSRSSSWLSPSFSRDILDIGFAGVARRRGTFATGVLASFFIVAQVAQNYFSASYGVLIGGVVAGAFLFAASPIQHAIEGRGWVPARGEAADPRIVDAYRHAVRAAIADGRVTRAEEVHLGEVAASLGITAADAARLRHEVEDEKQ